MSLYIDSQLWQNVLEYVHNRSNWNHEELRIQLSKHIYATLSIYLTTLSLSVTVE